jgi:hypothetical protein
MSTTVRRVSQASLLLLCYAAGSCYVGERQYWRESQELEQWMEASGFYMSHISPDANMWQILAFVFFFLSFPVALAAFRLWRQETTASSSTPGTSRYIHSSEDTTHPE